MEFNLAKDFDGLMFEVHKLPPKADILKAFPDLKLYPEFRAEIKSIPKDKAFKYVVYRFDLRSPLRSIENIGTRKYKAAALAGFKLNSDGVFDSAVEEMLQNQNEQVNAMTLRFLRLHKNPKYTHLSVIYEAYHTQLNKVLQGELSDYKIVKDMQQEIEKLTNDLLDYERGKQIMESLYEFVEEDSLQLRPEDIALKMRNGETPIRESEIR